MLSKHELYRVPVADYEAMSAQKNAPRWSKALKKIGKLPTAKPALA
jgi:transposase